MKFTYDEYELLITTLKNCNYMFCKYTDFAIPRHTVIMRHDIDLDLNKALELARFESSLDIESTYFVLLATDFYNVMTKNGCDIIRHISSFGHAIGLHFDQAQYEINSVEELKAKIYFESNVLSEIVQRQIDVVSMHRPTQLFLDANIDLDGLINSYSQEFFVDMKYLSDSRMLWRENVMDIVNSKEFSRLHILTHPFWYSKREESMRKKLKVFLNEATSKRWGLLNSNFKNLEEVIRQEEINWLIPKR